MIDRYKYFDEQEMYCLKLNIVSALLALIIFIVDLQVPLGVAGGVPYIMVVLLSLWSPKPYLILYIATVCSVLTLLGFYFSPAGGEFWAVISNRVIALFAIWVTAVLVLRWKLQAKKLLTANEAIEKEKEKIYLATIHGAQHITNNLLNELKIVEFEIENHPEFDKEVSSMFNDMLTEANNLIKNLSSVENIDDDVIRKSIYPK